MGVLEMKEINGELSAKGLKIAIAASRFNSFLVEQLVKGAEDAFIRMGGSEKDLTLVRVLIRDCPFIYLSLLPYCEPLWVRTFLSHSSPLSAGAQHGPQ